MIEEWRPVPGFPGYEVSDGGRLRSIHNRWGILHTPRILKVGPNSQGYYTTILKNVAGGRTTVKVHRLVLLAFVGEPPPGKPDGCHGDGDPSNNTLGNLRWDHRSGNMVDAVNHRTHVQSRKDRCANGHPYTTDNTRVTPKGWRRCITCWGNS